MISKSGNGCAAVRAGNTPSLSRQILLTRGIRRRLQMVAARSLEYVNEALDA